MTAGTSCASGVAGQGQPSRARPLRAQRQTSTWRRDVAALPDTAPKCRSIVAPEPGVPWAWELVGVRRRPSNVPRISAAALCAAVALLGVSCTNDGQGSDSLESTSSSQVALEPIRVQYFEVLGERHVELALDYCGNDYRLEVAETAERVEVLVEAPPQGDSGDDCGALATVILDEPLGDRPLANARTGNAISQVNVGVNQQSG